MRKPWPPLIAFALYGALAPLLFAQSASPTTPAPLPYKFTNFIWWTDAELRSLLKDRIPWLGDEITPDLATEAAVRIALTDLLSEKNIHAKVVAFEPGEYPVRPGRDPDKPQPILFDIVDPKILIERVVLLDDPPADAREALSDTAHTMAGMNYEAPSMGFYEEPLMFDLQQLGYLSATVVLQPGAIARDGDNFIVPLTAIIAAGPKYRVGSVTVDGGPLFRGKDLSRYISPKAGEVPDTNALGLLENTLRAAYWRGGYSDVEFNKNPTFDTVHGLVSYNFTVTPGPQYRLRTLKIEGLDTARQMLVKDRLGIKPGDIYPQIVSLPSLSDLSTRPDSPLSGYGIGYTEGKDKAAAAIDLTLEFRKP